MSVRESAFKDLQERNSVEVTRFRVGDEKGWDEFVWFSNNGTIFHTRQFLAYHPPGRFDDCSLLFTKAGKCIAIFPAGVREIDRGKALISHPGASFGGPVFKLTISLKDTFFIVERLLEFAGDNGIETIQMTLPPLIYHSRPGNYFDFALGESGFSYLRREVSSVIPLDFAAEDTLLVFSPESRRAVRRALKMGVQVSECDDFSTFYDILKKNLQMRHNVRPTHSLDELLLLKQSFPEKIRLFAAQRDGEMMAGIVVFECNERVALAFYISHREELQQHRGVNLLFYEVIRWAISKQIKFLDFGIFTVNMKPNWGLARFKEGFGALGVFRDTLIKKV